MARNKRKRARKTAAKKKAEKKSRPQSGHKKSSKKTKPERKEEKGSSRLKRKAQKRIDRLLQDGIIILIDQPNLEIGKKEEEKEKDDKKEWTVKYSKLKEIVARGDPRSNSKSRKVLETYIVTSKKSQEGSNCQLSKRCQEANNIEYLVSPVRDTTKEKAVDCMIVRKIVEEYAAIEMLLLQGKKRPKRTFCILSADSDFVDVVREVREKGYDVELWFYNLNRCYSDKNWKAATEDHKGWGSFKKHNLETLKGAKKISRWREKGICDGDWSEIRSMSKVTSKLGS